MCHVAHFNWSMSLQCHFSFLLKLFFYKIAIIVSSSNNSDKREIDEYHDESNNSSSSGSDSSVSSSSDEHYSSVVPRVPLEVLQEELRQRMTSSSLASLSFHVPVSIPPSGVEEDILYCYAIGVPSKIDEKKLGSIKSWYQIPNDLNPRLAVRGEWCFSPCLGVGIYEAYLLGGLRLPLNAFAREILYRLGIGINQLNPNAWRLIISIQVL